jgi:hypothetical protein
MMVWRDASAVVRCPSRVFFLALISLFHLINIHKSWTVDVAVAASYPIVDNINNRGDMIFDIRSQKNLQ